MTEQPVVDFAGLLRQLRGRAGLTQEELAEAAGLSLRAVSDLERGFHRTARKDTALLLADALGVAGPARELFVAAARGRAPAADVLAAGGALPGAGGTAGRQAGMGRPLVASPYLGLRAFGERDAGLFFGREAATAEVLARISWLVGAAGVLVVSGVSGAGKSSLLRAGVLPQVRAAGLASAPEAASWPCQVFTPTRAPLDELALRIAPLAGADAAAVRRGLDADPAGFALTARQAALAQPGPARDLDGSEGRDQPQRRLVLVVDQFEELFTQCADEGQRRAFITALHAAATASHGPSHTPAALALLGLRADFEAHCADYPQLAGAIQDRYLVTAMTERQLRMAITEPAKKAGSKVDSDLVNVLLGEVRNGQPGIFAAGVLPLLSHALDQAWRSGTGTAVTLADYERTGGIEGAVAASAQRAYDALTPTQKETARQVFTRLTATSSEGIDSADRATRADLTAGKTPAEAQQVEQVLEAFAAERLLTLAAGTVELSHEILLTAWPLLRDTWLADTHADRITRTRLRTTATEWDHHTRDPSYLYTGTLLQTATQTAARISADPTRHPPLSPTERDFLHSSNHAHRRRALQRHALLVFLIALVFGLTSVTVLAVRAGQRATRERDVAVSTQLGSQSQLLGDANPVLSKLLSIAAWRLNPSSYARYAMMEAAGLPGIAVLTGQTSPVISLAFSPNGKTLASGSADAAVRLWDVATRQQIGKPLPVHSGQIIPAVVQGLPFSSVAFSPNGKILASGNTDGKVRLWDVATGRPRKPFITHTSQVLSVAFSPDGKILAASSNDGVRLFNVVTGRQILIPASGPPGYLSRPGKPGIDYTGWAWSVAFSPDSQTLAVGYRNVRLFSVVSGRQIGQPLPVHFGYSVAFSPNGQTLAVGSQSGTVQLWSVATHQQIATLTGHTGPVYSVAFSPNGQTLASGSQDGTVRLWNVATHQQIATLTGHTGPVDSVAFSPNGQTLASSSADDTVRLWNVPIGRLLGNPHRGSTDEVNSLAFSPDGKILASAHQDGIVRLWDVTTGRQLGVALTGKVSPGVEGPTSVAFSPDGKTLAVSAAKVQLWNITTGHRGTTLTIHRTAFIPVAVMAIAFSPHGKTLATGERLWNLATSHLNNQSGTAWHNQSGTAWSVAFSPNGQTLASGNQDGAVWLWDVPTGRQLGAPLVGDAGPVYSVAFSPNGRTLAAGNADGTVRLWDVATGRQIGAPLTGHTGPVYSVAFSPNGQTLASGSADGTVRLWDVATGRQIGATLTSNTGPVNSVAFSPDGNTLATANEDGTVQFWDVAYTMDTLPQLCAAAGRNLTRAEWAQYVPQGPEYQSTCP